MNPDLPPGSVNSATTPMTLGVVALFSRGVDENNTDRLLSTTSNRGSIPDKLCVFSLAHLGDGSATMLAPHRDYTGPRDPISSPLLRTAKVRRLNRCVRSCQFQQSRIHRYAVDSIRDVNTPTRRFRVCRHKHLSA